MPKETLKRFMPTPARLRKLKVLHVLGDWIYQPNLWHITRMSSSRAFFIGLFVAFMPFPLQMVAAALLSIWLRANLPIAVGLCWITNPVTIGPIFYMSYRVGAAVIGEIPQSPEFELSWEWITHGFLTIWQPFLLGCLLCGFFFGSLGYFSINYLWRWNAIRAWRARRDRRQLRLAEANRDVELRLAEEKRRAEQDKAPPESTSPPSQD